MKRYVQIIGHSNGLGRKADALQSGLADPYEPVTIVEMNSRSSDPPEFVRDGPRPLSPRTKPVAGLPAGYSGIELTMGRALDRAMPNQWVIGKMTLDGSGLKNQWVNPNYPSQGLQMLDLLFGFIDEQLEVLDASFEHLVWCHGEVDAGESPDALEYLPNMNVLRDRIRGRYRNVGIAFYRIPADFSAGGTALVTAAQDEFLANNSRVARVVVDGIPRQDASHFTDRGYEDVGELFARAILSMTMDVGRDPFDVAIHSGGTGFDVLAR